MRADNGSRLLSIREADLLVLILLVSGSDRGSNETFALGLGYFSYRLREHEHLKSKLKDKKSNQCKTTYIWANFFQLTVTPNSKSKKNLDCLESIRKARQI